MPTSFSIEEKQHKDRKAFSQIHLDLSNQILQDVLKEKIAIPLWLKLELCMSKNLTVNCISRHQIYSHRLTKGTSLKIYFNQI